MGNIKLFVCCHRKTEIPTHPLLIPVQVGAALSEEHFSGFQHDDTGNHISEKNRSYCELTAQYWAWKNIEADYYGFFHYRRILYPDETAMLPYRLEKHFDLSTLQVLRYASFDSFISQYDLIAPMGENMHVSVREHYAKAPFHHKKDLDLLEEIIRKCSPDYIPAMERYLSGETHFFGNMFIMRREIFQNYCEWVFPILSDVDRLAECSKYSVQEARVDGYLGERMFGIFFTRAVMESKLRCASIPKAEFEADSRKYAIRKMENFFLPPGSHRRAVVKRKFREIRSIW